MSLHDLYNKALEQEVITRNANTQVLRSDMSDNEILDYIFVRLCTVLDTKSIVFRGGYILTKIIKTEIVRKTYDIDFDVSIQEYYDKVKGLLTDIGKELVNHSVIDSYNFKCDISMERAGGIDFIRNSQKKKKLGLDIGVRDESECTVPICINGFDILITSAEQMLADKLNTVCSKARLRRAKDLYDFYIISNCNNVNMDVFRKCISRYDISIETSPFVDDDILVKYKHAYDNLTIIGTDDEQVGFDIDGNKIDFNTALERVRIFIDYLDNGVFWSCSERTMH